MDITLREDLLIEEFRKCSMDQGDLFNQTFQKTVKLGELCKLDYMVMIGPCLCRPTSLSSSRKVNKKGEYRLHFIGKDVLTGETRETLKFIGKDENGSYTTQIYR